jgi:hypothetical protein
MRKQLLVANIVFICAASFGVAAEAQLPVRRVVLYKNGMGYFEHAGAVPEKQDVEITLPAAQLNDVLKSLTVIDPDRGQVPGVTYDSAEPLDRRLAELPVRLDASQGLIDFLNKIRGTQVEVRSGVNPVTGRLMGAEIRRRQVGEAIVRETVELSIFTTQGELRTIELTSPGSLRIVRSELASDVGRYLEMLDSAHQRDVRRLKIHTAALGTRRLQVSYTSEAPVWKSTYRIVLDADHKPLLQGWAIVDNTTPVDWTNVELSLVSGAPISFIQNLSSPLYTRRPVIPMPEGTLITPQMHEAMIVSGTGESAISGRVTDPTGAAIPNAVVEAYDELGGRKQTTAGSDGRYRLTVAPGSYRVEASSPGFSTARYSGVEVAAGRITSVDFRLMAGSTSETLQVFAGLQRVPSTSASGAGSGGGIGSGSAGGVGPGSGGGFGGGTFVVRQQTPELPKAQPIGEQFEYKLQQPVTLRRNQTALLPIVHTEVEGEKVTLFNDSGDRKPRLAVWLKNSSRLTLDGGSFTVIDSNSFAGEGLTDNINPDESRLLSYALDLKTRVSTNVGTASARFERVEIKDGGLKVTQTAIQNKAYTIRSNDDKPGVVVIEHPVRSDWTLASSGQPAETTAHFYRFRVAVEPKSTTYFSVREEKQELAIYSLFEFNEANVDIWIRQGVLDRPMERSLRDVLAKRKEISDLEKAAADLTAEERQIGEDQKRLRENLGTLGASREETSLRQRYVNQLEQQEDRLAQIRSERAKLQTSVAAARKRMEEMVNNLSFDRKL